MSRIDRLHLLVVNSVMAVTLFGFPKTPFGPYVQLQK
jgi:hypothetical protein